MPTNIIEPFKQDSSQIKDSKISENLLKELNEVGVEVNSNAEEER